MIGRFVLALATLAVAASLVTPVPAIAQIQMPDAREMSGIPRPVTDLPDRTVSVRLIRGDLSNNIAKHPVELLVDGKSQTVTTGEDGRAQFGPLSPGARLQAIAVVDGERLQSEEFPAPQQGGIRLMLVATDPERAAQASAPAVTGEVILGGDTRFVVERGDEIVRVFYLLDIVNAGKTAVNTAEPFLFDTPTGAQGTTVMEGSSSRASATGPRILVQGPFPPGTTSVQVGYILPTPRGTASIEQRFPVRLERLGALVEQVGEVTVSSPQIERQQEMPIADRTYIAAAGGSVSAGEPLVLSVSGLPHHSLVPRYVALALIALIVAGGVWIARMPIRRVDTGDRKRLAARREKLMQDLVGLETDHRRGAIDDARFAARRESIVTALEQVYRATDPDDTSPGPAPRTGLAA